MKIQAKENAKAKMNVGSVRGEMEFTLLQKDSLYVDGNKPTPIDLVKEINDKIDYNKDDKVLVLFDYMFAIDVAMRLKVKNVYLTMSSFNPKTYRWLKLLNITPIEMEQAKEMKFDVGLMNPPFSLNGNDIYQTFFNFITDQCDTVGVVCPPKLLDNLKKGKHDSLPINQHYPSFVSVNAIKKKHFKNIGCDICYFIADTNSVPKKTIVETVNGTTSLDLRNEELNVASSTTALEFLKKYGSGEKFSVSSASLGDTNNEETIKGAVKRFDSWNHNEQTFENVVNVQVSKKKRFADGRVINTPKLIMPRYQSGKIEELFLDHKGEYISHRPAVYMVICDTDLDVVMNNAKRIMEEYKVAFKDVPDTGFVWCDFFKRVSKEALTQPITETSNA